MSTPRVPKTRWAVVAGAIALLVPITAATAALAAGTTQGVPTLVGMQRGVPVVDPTTVAQLTDPGVELTAAVDGRLRGDGIALIVGGAALTDRAGKGSEAVSAGAGRHLIVFSLRQVPQPADASTATASLALVTAGDRRPIDFSRLSGHGPWNFAASIPGAATDVDLELSGSGFTQRFSLMTLNRPGPDPAVLYRDADNPAVVDQDNSAVGVGVTTGPPDSGTYALMVGAATTTIGWFAPDASRHTPASPDQAFLAVQFATQQDPNKPSSYYLKLPSAVPAEKVHLILSDGTDLAATHVADDTTGNSSGINSIFPGTYYFTVPANISAATISVDAYSASGLAGGFFADPSNIALSAFTIALALTPPPVEPPPTTPVTALKLTHSAGSSSGSGTSGVSNPTKSSSRAPLWIVLILLAAGGTVTWAARRQRRAAPQPATTDTLPVRPAPPPPPAPTSVTVATAGTRPTAPPPTAPAAPAKPAAPMQIPPLVPPASPPPGTTPPVAAPPVPATQPSPLVHATAAAAPEATAPESAAVEGSPTASDPPTTNPASVGTATETNGSTVVSVSLLGPRQLSGPGTAKLRPRDIEVFVFLAVNSDRSVTNDDVRAAVAGAADDEPNAKTARTWLSRVRGALGNGVLPDADNGRYRLHGVDTDIARFEHLTARAAAATDTAEATGLLKDALRLVRGRPFGGLDYRWTAVIAARLETEIADAASRLAELSGELRDPDGAAWAAQRGLAG